jgi:hypothetical protein
MHGPNLPKGEMMQQIAMWRCMAVMCWNSIRERIVCSNFWVLVQILCSFYVNRFEPSWPRSLHFLGLVVKASNAPQDLPAHSLTRLGSVELAVG